jgi:hypothetical protein
MQSVLRVLTVLSIAGFAMGLTACSGAPKASVDGGNATDAAVEAAPVLTEAQAEKKIGNAQEDATDLEKENHELRKQIFELKSSLGMEVDNGQEAVAEPKPAKEEATPAKVEKAEPAKAKKAPAKKRK